MYTGKLIVFEGPDGVGKSELALRFQSWLLEHDSPAELLAFPGKDEGTLGRLVYDLHSNPQHFRVNSLTASSLQALHIAAHLDAIERRILPSLKTHRTVILDRFWWSTYVYGMASHVIPDVLEQMIRAEKVIWRGVVPKILFLIDRDQPLRPEPSEFWARCRELYRELLASEAAQYPCDAIDNHGSIERTFQQLIASWLKSTTTSSSEASNWQK